MTFKLSYLFLILHIIHKTLFAKAPLVRSECVNFLAMRTPNMSLSYYGQIPDMPWYVSRDVLGITTPFVLFFIFLFFIFLTPMFPTKKWTGLLSLTPSRVDFCAASDVVLKMNGNGQVGTANVFMVTSIVLDTGS